MANSLEMKMTFPSDAEIAQLFGTIPKLEYYGVLDKTVKAGAEIIAAKAKLKAPRSKPGDRKKRSASQKEGADWEYPLWKTIAYKVKRYGGVRGYGIVGPKWPKGNKAYFNTSPKGNKGHHWGYAGTSYFKKNGGVHYAGKAKARAQVRNWIVEAFDETKEAQLSAMKAKLTETVDAMMKGG